MENTNFVESQLKFGLKLVDYSKQSYICFRKSPRYFLMRKLARFEIIRSFVSYLYKSKATFSQQSASEKSVFKNINIDAVVAALTSDGYYLGLDLPPDVLQEIQEFAAREVCYGDRDLNLSFYYHEKYQRETELNRQFYLGSYLNKIDKCQAICQLQTDPILLNIAAKFLGGTPVHVGSELVWSFPVTTTPLQQLKAAQVFHYDIDDYRFIKFFFYLTDTDAASGPHICIQKSHKNKSFMHQILGVRCASIEDDTILDCYGSDNVMTICGKAGLGFVEDPYCFHKGTPPSGKERLLLQIEFALHNYGDIRSF